MLAVDQNLPFSSPALVIDASMGRVFAGLLDADGNWISYQKSELNALEGLFIAVESCLEEGGLSVKSIHSYIYCEGPGSVLGLRLCAMALRTWQRLSNIETALYRFNSLQLCQALIQKDFSNPTDALLVSDWKKGVWHSLGISRNQISEVRPIDSSELSQFSGPIYHLPQRKGWQTPPVGAIEIEYQPERLNEIDYKLFSKCDTVELFSAGANTFQKWKPERHRVIQ